jgi:hypothetical protein
MLLLSITCILIITINIILAESFFNLKQDFVRSLSLSSSIICFFISLFF